MRYLRLASAAIVGYMIVAGGLSLIVMTWWINETLPLTRVWIGVIVIALLACGWIAGRVTALIAGELRKPAVYLVAGLTFAVLTMNIVLDVAVEPLWFKLTALVLVIVAALGSLRSTSKES
jgi:hypothetical protein